MPLVGQSPEPGDLIEFFRPFYQHWGIYVGNGYVVHLTDQEGWSGISSALGSKAIVRKERVEKVAGTCNYRVNNKYDKKRIPNPPQKVVQAALMQVGQEKPYSVPSANCEHFVTELRYETSYSDQGQSPEPGDLIEFFRPFYQHWGIYVGNGYVVHLTDQEGWSGISSALGSKAIVRKERVEKVAGTCNYRVNNKYDKKRIPNPPQKVVQAALMQVGQEKPYSVPSANCEHFVTELRYETSYSDQGQSPEPGDLIEFFRPFYQHWGIYVGNGYVVHLTDQEGWSGISSALGSKAIVRKERVEKVAGTCNYRVNNKYDKKRIPNPPQKVVQAALMQVGKEKPYSVPSANCEHFVTELRYETSYSDQGQSPEPGDLIEFFRPFYQHWGIYVGNGYVVHLTDQEGWSGISSALGSKAIVRKERVEKVAGTCNYRVNNKYDKKRIPNPPQKVVQAALMQVGKEKPYSVPSANCEHFVTELRYETSYSDQVDNAKVYGLTGGAVVLGIIAAVAFSSMRNKRQNQ